MAVRTVLAIFVTIWAVISMATAQELSALARFDAASSHISDRGKGIAVDLVISQPVPWRVRVMDAPPRLVLDVREVDWSGLKTSALTSSSRVVDLRAGVFRPGWSRLVLELDGPYLVTASEMVTGQGAARVQLLLDPATETAFAEKAALPEPDAWAVPAPIDLPLPKARQRGEGPLVVVLDAGHGGLDPGAERDGISEADLMLIFARELQETLRRAGGFIVVMTRVEDVFVPLETRISVARAAGADVFLSLHADALAEGEAVGATIYTLADAASDAAAATLAERHDRADLLAGVDLTDQDDVIAHVLMDMARTETTPRTDRLADSLVAAIKDSGLVMHRHPRQSAAFSVLKSPDIPSVLIELGFLSSARDLARLEDAGWRAQMAAAVLAGLRAWATADAAEAALIRQ